MEQPVNALKGSPAVGAELFERDSKASESNRAGTESQHNCRVVKLRRTFQLWYLGEVLPDQGLKALHCVLAPQRSQRGLVDCVPSEARRNRHRVDSLQPECDILVRPARNRSFPKADCDIEEFREVLRPSILPMLPQSGIRLVARLCFGIDTLRDCQVLARYPEEIPLGELLGNPLAIVYLQRDAAFGCCPRLQLVSLGYRDIS